ncbi:DMT family transporter [Streptomyces mexicanus]|uniref:DMT family transporter n=1 Tax=Streptomyces mexicanus TaxID=178566 RepID=A0A7X1I6H2_9ACTN|nr:DMT family transporter [Streptomyces mexicanus]MBC2869670.1 DMT family transporter [Streptomyces mexicanus]
MNALTVVLALLAALCNASASVLQRRAATDETESGSGARQALRWLGRVLRRPYWLAGAGLLGLSTVLQAAALAVGSLSLVQPLLATELLFTLAVGSVVFRRRPDGRTWAAFVALAVGLALFLGAASPSEGRSTADPAAWLAVGAALVGLLAVALGASRLVHGTARAALLGLASAVSFAATAALMKESMGRLQQGITVLLSDWPVYATLVVGALSFLLLQSAFRAGSLTASQPALTLGDALTSVALGWVLFEEYIGLGVRVLPEVIGAVLIGAGSIGLARATATDGGWDTSPDRRGGPGPGTERSASQRS